ncbi:hydratase [Methylopila turkensis]|uniref:Carotenoid 1,2-hydratase n=1 Tax=Methylopila turkensis TaxID=1437816 RepID=A0A9W6JLA9_9HYPH|nr:hydratase [Methylopila turkensis]GLK78273.1 carotenoid 1,2-hydratase [Methylopila turkensis]
MFSPYYAFARRRGGALADPENHCAINIALYGPGGRWAMTERGRRSMSRGPDRLVVGPSDIAWDGRRLTIRFDEVCAPLPKRLRGVVRVTPGLLMAEAFAIDGEGRHCWRPISPFARIEVECESPALRWTGDGYFDCNDGDEPLEAAFARWSWASARTESGAKILYDMELRRGGPLSLALAVSREGAIEPFSPPARKSLKKPFWRMERPVRCDDGSAIERVATLEDSPFYARSRVATRLCGEDVTLMHESLSLDRFASPVVQAMLPFRMPRRA